MREIFELSEEAALEGLLESELAGLTGAGPDLDGGLLECHLADHAPLVGLLYVLAHVHHHFNEGVLRVVQLDPL